MKGYIHILAVGACVMLAVAFFSDMARVLEAQEVDRTHPPNRTSCSFEELPPDETEHFLCEDTTGVGWMFGPRDARQEIFLWDCCGEFWMRTTQRGRPYGNNLWGPVDSEVVIRIPHSVYIDMLEQFLQPDECVEVRP